MKFILFLLIFALYQTLLFGNEQNEALAVSEHQTSAVDLELGESGSKYVLKYKDLKRSNINFNNINVSKFLSFKKWKEDTDEKDLYPDWESIIKERSIKELAGHFFQCVGTCRVDRAESFFNPTFRSNLYEGDEIQTLDDSYAWLFLNDGTMVRLAPNSSLTINEFNVGEVENFLSARINYGNIYWLSRLNNTYTPSSLKETDALFFPLSYYDAEAEVHEVVYDEEKLINFLADTDTTRNQYHRLNKLISENNEILKDKKTYTFLVAPNVSVIGYSPAVEFIVLLGGRTYIKNKAADDLNIEGDYNPNLMYQLRGYENKELTNLDVGVWLEVDEKGKKLRKADDISFKVVGEFITKRIPSILVARELMFKDYSKLFYDEKLDRKSLAEISGYRLWGKIEAQENKKDDLYLRLEFLKEYFRRIETTNLLNTEKFRKQMLERGEVIKATEYGPYFFKRALDAYYKYDPKIEDEKNHDFLNSTTKKIWKIMHGIR